MIHFAPRASLFVMAASLLVAAAAPAPAVELRDFAVTRPAGVTGLMFDEELCFPEEWRAAATVNVVGGGAVADLWLTPLAFFGAYLEEGVGPPVWVVADDLRITLAADAAGYRRMQTEYGAAQAAAHLRFLACVAATDPAVFQRYLDVAAGGGGAEALVAQIVPADATRRAELADRLVVIGAPAVGPLITLLVGTDPAAAGALALQLIAIRALGRIGPPSADAAPILSGLFGNERGTVRAAARQSLVQIGPAALPFVIPMLSHPDPRVRLDAVLVLGAIAPPPAEALAMLQRLAAADPDAGIRDAAMAAAQRILAPPAP